MPKYMEITATIPIPDGTFGSGSTKILAQAEQFYADITAQLVGFDGATLSYRTVAPRGPKAKNASNDAPAAPAVVTAAEADKIAA